MCTVKCARWRGGVNCQKDLEDTTTEDNYNRERKRWDSIMITECNYDCFFNNCTLRYTVLVCINIQNGLQVNKKVQTLCYPDGSTSNSSVKSFCHI